MGAARRLSQIKPAGAPHLVDATRCPACSSDTAVYATRSAIRYRKCHNPLCGQRFRTQEVTQSAVDHFLRQIQAAREILVEQGVLSDVRRD